MGTVYFVKFFFYNIDSNKLKLIIIEKDIKWVRESEKEGNEIESCKVIPNDCSLSICI